MSSEKTNSAVDRAEYYISVVTTVGSAMIAGWVLTTNHELVTGWEIRIASAAFWVVLAIIAMNASRGQWLELHGISSVAVEMDAVREDWSNEE